MKFRELCQQYHIPTAPDGHHHARAGWIQLDCPLCSKSQRRWRMGFNTAGNYFNCWSCGQLRLGETLMALTGESWSVVKKLLGELDVEKRVERVHRGRLVLPDSLGDLAGAHRRYLKSRGFNPTKLVRLWGLQGIGIAARLQWRIFIPVVFQGEVVSWTTRSIRDDGVRYLSAREQEEALPHKNLLYGEDYCRHACVVHEGPTDVWSTGPGAVATLGTAYSRAQVARIARYPCRVICFDNEPTAQRRARKLANDLEVFPGDTYNVVLKAKDAGSSKEIWKLRERFLD